MITVAAKTADSAQTAKLRVCVMLADFTIPILSEIFYKTCRNKVLA